MPSWAAVRDERTIYVPTRCAVRLVGGLLALWLAWLAVAQARVIGVNFLLSVLLLVWMADIAAYFAGRAFGLGGRSVISLCRCGLSANKPFCDGQHARQGWQSPCEARDLPPPKPKV